VKLEDELSTTGRRSSQIIEGSTRWMAPEHLDGQPLDFPSDVYSYAITAWELHSEQVPFHGVLDRVLHRLVVDKKERPNRPESLTCSPLWNVITRCWEAEPEMRPTFLAIQADLKQLVSSNTVPADVSEIEDEETLHSMHILGTEHAVQGQFIDAEIVFKQVIAG